MATLQLYDGCGCLIEEWKYEHAWPQTVDFGDLEMNNSEFVTADVTLRYDRAYITSPVSLTPLNFDTVIQTCPIGSCPEVPSVVCPEPCPSVTTFAAVEPEFSMLW